MVVTLLGIAFLAVVAITFAFRTIGAFTGAFLAVFAILAYFGCAFMFALVLFIASLSFVAFGCLVAFGSFITFSTLLAFLFSAFLFGTLSLSYGSGIHAESDDGCSHQ